MAHTCQLLVTENARLSSFLSLLMANHRLPSVSSAEWAPTASYNGAVFAGPHQPLHSLPSNGGFFPSPGTSFRQPESTSGLSSIQSLVPAPPTPRVHMQHSLSLEKALDQVQVLTTFIWSWQCLLLLFCRFKWVCKDACILTLWFIIYHKQRKSRRGVEFALSTYHCEDHLTFDQLE